MATSARLEELRKKFDENPRRYFAPLANEYRKQGDLSQAIALCRTHLPNQPGHISGHIVLAQALYESRELGESRHSFEQALDLDPENLIALRYLGDIAREQGAPDAAQGWYERVLEADPRNDEIADLIRTVQAEAAATADRATSPTPVRTVAQHDDFAPPAQSEDESFSAFASHRPELASVDFAAPSAEQSVKESETSWEARQIAPDEPDDLSTSWFGESHTTPAPGISSIEGAATPSFSPALESDLGDLEAVADPDMSDWFSAPAPAPAPAAASGEDLFPDLSAAQSLVSESEPFDSFSGAVEADAFPEALDVVEATPVSAAGAFSEFDLDLEAAEEAGPAAQGASDLESPVVDPQESGEAEFQVEMKEAARAEDPEEFDAYVSAMSDGVTSEPLESWDPHIGRTPALGNPVAEAPPAPFVTETMAELYLQQGFNEEALAIYRQLLEQNPADATLRQRVLALEEGERSPVTTPLTTLTQPATTGPSVREFFERFARNGAAGPAEGAAAARGDHVPIPSFGGAATHDEALTQPDAPHSRAPGLDEMFGAPALGSSDEAPAANLAAAFAAAESGTNTPELSLDSLFGDVPALPADAVTSVARASGPDSSAPLSAGPDGEANADVEQFTAWLEGLKKK